ncbi:MAG: ribonuclease H-like domain-containing protein [Clostridia bacterium]|nr:ribonuclease H-like domain-containing protein [Clostridia bacterium]
MGLFDFFKRRKKTVQNSDVAIHKEPEVVLRAGNVTATPFDIDSSTIEHLQKRYIAFDIETTGLSPYNDRIIEIGAVKYCDGKACELLSTLVNPHKTISPEATSVNHITNEMLANAPTEEVVYPQLMSYLGDAITGETVLCAHNARFDMDFLRNTLSRLGYDANIVYVDTLKLSRQYIEGLLNYKQGTVANHYGIQIEEAHRAADDARVCGEILLRLLPEINMEIIEQQRRIEKTYPLPQELETCAYIQNTLVQFQEDITHLRFRRNSSNYVEATILYPFLRFKTSSKGKYIIIPKEVANDLPNHSEICTASEGGAMYSRLFYSSITELEPLASFIVTAFQSSKKSFLRYTSNSKRANAEAMQIIQQQKRLSSDEVASILSSAQKNAVVSSDSITQKHDEESTNPTITRESVVINAKNSRVPLSEIHNLDNWHKGFDEGSPYYFKGEEARKAGDLENAIRLFDRARYNGYDAPALYDSYVKTYRQMKDYENEIEICEEGMKRLHPSDAGLLESRRDRAIKLLFAVQEKERIQLEKLQKAAERKAAKPEKKASEKVSPTVQGRGIIQLTDDNCVVCEYESIAAAVRATGINSKSIRDAANGVQRHAGGYCWKYKQKDSLE